ncbi:dATP/dGTP diphosphohydrolase domain-containing protein [Cupriavidus sp. UYPR2.512]|uniref:dATP/dGTP diphosphohydrolase domain-containing protein n=1 Tax=Cupriavidus sp. UYPR2.512 TaxID=1080187 RepID=UPI00036ABAB3|nr:dATP/dGTP diphosphohydrolase domain-containing protein [Cupriavidus sp. UYPR2.512]UIF90883.1 hypothetical protein KAF44_32360 [Cupriavidus necator]
MTTASAANREWARVDEEFRRSTRAAEEAALLPVLDGAEKALQSAGFTVAEPGATKDTNPKDAIGDKKVPLWLLSPIAKAHWALAQFAGMCKYQAWNWRAAGVRNSVYLSAMQRHLDAYMSGEETDPVDGTHHLGNIMACAAILLDAKAAGKLTDDRPPIVGVRDTYEFVQATMADLREKYKHIAQRPHTIADGRAEGQ